MSRGGLHGQSGWDLAPFPYLDRMWPLLACIFHESLQRSAWSALSEDRPACLGDRELLSGQRPGGHGRRAADGTWRLSLIHSLERRPVLGFLGLFPVAFSSGAPYLARIEPSGPPPVRHGSPACGTPRPHPSCPSRHHTRCPSAARGTPLLGPRVGPSHSPAGSSGTPGHLLGAAHSYFSALDITHSPHTCLPPGIFPDSPPPTPPAQG